MSFIQEFKAFAMRGNVIDLAVAVIVGAAFSKIIASLVDGIIMPSIGLLLGGIDVSGKTIQVGSAVIKWGLFLQSVIDFTLIAFCIFIVIKVLSSLHEKRPVEEAVTEEVKLLREIRDSLRREVM